MLTPGRVGEQTGGAAQPLLVRALAREQRRGEKLDLVGLATAAAEAFGGLVGGFVKRVAGAGLGRQRLVEHALAHPVGRDDHPVELPQPHQPVQHQRPEGQRLGAAARHAGHALQRLLALRHHELRDAQRLDPRHLVAVQDVQRIAGAGHVQAGDVPPDAADRVERAALELLQPGQLHQAGVDDGPRPVQTAARHVHQPQRTEGQRRPRPQHAVLEAGQLQTAAAEIADQPVGVRQAADDAERRQFGLLLAGQHLDRTAAGLLRPADEIRPVGGVAGGGGGDRMDPAHPHRGRHQAEALQRRQRELHALGVQPPGRHHVPADRADRLFVEQGDGIAVRRLEDDEAHGIGADVDHAEHGRPASTTRGARDTGNLSRCACARSGRSAGC